MRRLPRRIGYRIRFSPLDGLVFGLGFWIAWAIAVLAVDVLRPLLVDGGRPVMRSPQ